MLLDSITCPEDLRGLTNEQLVDLATEIRTVIVGSVAQSGGHLDIQSTPGEGTCLTLTLPLERREATST